jgi:hypothetical protein
MLVSTNRYKTRRTKCTPVSTSTPKRTRTRPSPSSSRSSSKKCKPYLRSTLNRKCGAKLMRQTVQLTRRLFLGSLSAFSLSCSGSSRTKGELIPRTTAEREWIKEACRPVTSNDQSVKEYTHSNEEKERERGSIAPMPCGAKLRKG